jgi:RNA polymerase sigma-70 factor (ECF subfamily)
MWQRLINPRGFVTQYLFDELIERSKHGESDAFRCLVERHQGYVFALAFRIVCDENVAKDVVQESFIRVWKHLQEYDPAIKFTTWLYRIVVNLSFDQLKMDKRRKRVIENEQDRDERLTVGNSVMEQSLINRDLADKIRAVAERLPLKQRQVFVLRDLNDLSVKETAEVLAMSSGSVKANLSYARQTIRKQMERLDHVREV